VSILFLYFGIWRKIKHTLFGIKEAIQYPSFSRDSDKMAHLDRNIAVTRAKQQQLAEEAKREAIKKNS